MSAQSLHSSALTTLRDWEAPTAEQDSLRHTYLAFLDASPLGCLRAHVPGHITASAVVFDADLSHVLLTLHPRVGRWIQLGGHCEPEDISLPDAARREAREESGIADLELTGGLVALHTHPITCSLGVPTRHLDMRFAAVAAAQPDGGLPPIEISDESVDLAWWPLDGLPTDTDDDMRALIDFGVAACRRP